MYTGETMKLESYNKPLQTMIDLLKIEYEKEKQDIKRALEWEETDEEKDVKKAGKAMGINKEEIKNKILDDLNR